MSTSNHTAAKPRGRRDTENADRPSRSRATSEASQKALKMTFRASDENAPLKSSRPGSPTLFMQRFRAMDQKISYSDAVSPKTSIASLRAEQQIVFSENDAPMVIPSTKPSPRSTPPVQAANDPQLEFQPVKSL